MRDPCPVRGRSWPDTFREIEQLGYATAFLPDHFHEGPGPLAAMAAGATATSTLIVGSLVLDCDFRHPAVLARELATIDHLAEGRLEVGLGAGWRAEDYRTAGIAMDRPGVRVSRMIEHTAVLRGLWGDGPFDFAGDHYTITELDGTPKPLTPGGPKLLIGGGAPGAALRRRHRRHRGVNASIHSGEIDTDAARRAPRTHRREGGLGARGRRRPLRRPGAQRLARRRRGHRRPAGPGRAGGPDVRRPRRPRCCRRRWR
ncbi:MAG: LLM class flavin-dependent oxidoreductase [Acidimicrobiales bacterium]